MKLACGRSEAAEPDHDHERVEVSGVHVDAHAPRCRKRTSAVRVRTFTGGFDTNTLRVSRSARAQREGDCRASEITGPNNWLPPCIGGHWPARPCLRACAMRCGCGAGPRCRCG